jgi:hypothetical protein
VALTRTEPGHVPWPDAWLVREIPEYRKTSKSYKRWLYQRLITSR